jgi:hypothetical protein
MRRNNLNNKSMSKLVNEVIAQKNYSILRLCNPVVYLKYANERMGYSEGSKILTIKNILS